ncbi:hypothetical protein [Pandoraea sp. NPDC090278]|uniref:hypothetical protein n=1 Tax=Pandoraea sp. NPDC090278 TaxID=3364391 RepID=UPI00383B98E5
MYLQLAAFVRATRAFERAAGAKVRCVRPRIAEVSGCAAWRDSRSLAAAVSARRRAQHEFIARGLASAARSHRELSCALHARGPQAVGFLLEQDWHAAEHALGSIRRATALLQEFPFTCRKVISFGEVGYVALFEIEGDAQAEECSRYVTILAVRHQREADYH